MEAAGGVHQHQISGAGAGGADGVVDDGGGVGAGLLAEQFSTEALGPNLQLLAGGGAKGVGGAEVPSRWTLTNFTAVWKTGFASWAQMTNWLHVP